MALEAAVVALIGDDLGKLPFVVGLSRRPRGVIRETQGFPPGVIAIVIAATTGHFGIGTAVLMHRGSPLAAIANGLRLLAYNGPRETRPPTRIAG